MKKFLIADDYTSNDLWSELQLSALPTLKSRPEGDGWAKALPDLPDGDWILAHAMNSMMPSSETYVEFGVRYIPTLAEMPAIFVVHEDGSFEKQLNVTAQQAGEFINSRI